MIAGELSIFNIVFLSDCTHLTDNADQPMPISPITLVSAYDHLSHRLGIIYDEFPQRRNTDPSGAGILDADYLCGHCCLYV